MTVLGLMSRAPVAGRCKTRLIPDLGARGAANLTAAMLQDSLVAFDRLPVARKVLLAAPEDHGVAVLKTFAPAGWEVVPQLGDDLGRRMLRAMKTLSGAGDAVVLVGSDAPTAPLEPLAQALPRLTGEMRALLGPADDGGYWLIGLTSPSPEVFRDVPWSTKLVLPRTRERLRAAGFTWEELPAAYDVDEPADLARLRAELAAHPERAPKTAALLRG
jgi:hypothetical protein